MTQRSGGSVMVQQATGGTTIVLDSDAPCTLSARELQIVELVAEGRSNVAIGEALHLSPLTVKSHLARIYRNLDAADRAHVVAICLREGWIK